MELTISVIVNPLVHGHDWAWGAHVWEPTPTPGPPVHAYNLQEFWDWAFSHRLVVTQDGKICTDVHISSLPPLCKPIGEPARGIVELGPGVRIVSDQTEQIDQTG